ncbi:MAG: DNA-directed RNA polymerase subunit A' [Nanoarchaeota archaeon]|nr:DNA-directed RNA polymerase subunit A' [Nanoarchaeota archaeon]MBU0963352.1 DNA-directed RNA polymerase subunit A' [Nanoarchaeota archaeon]
MEHIYKKIDAIIFGVFSPQMIKKQAAAKIVTPELYDKEGYPVDGGLMDVRMGVIDPGLRCKTCGGKLKECMGHFGFIEFARPIMHIKYVDTIYDFLRSTCKECSRILADEEKIKQQEELLESIKKEGRTMQLRKVVDEFISSLKNIKKCPYCKAKQGTVKLEKPITFLEDDRKMSPIEIRTRFEKLNDHDIELIGLNPAYAKPEWMVLTMLPVPPVTVRPSITLESGERSEDDLTHKLGDIVRINQRLFENINAGAPEVIVEDLWDLLQYHVITYFDNEIAQIPPARHRGGQPLKTLTDRIKSKQGRFRYNLAGKRVNYAARTVISPDPKIKLNEVGIPLAVAMDLTVPETVNEWNLEKLKSLIKNGSKVYPGANYVLRPNGTKKQITDETKQQLIDELEIGFIIERHLREGDISIFNRQPSLHRMSIMCHKIRILPGNSFRLNPSVCSPYNADFDGDEMNLHIPQTEEAIAEAEMLMQVQHNLITPKNGQNVVGCIEDATSGNYLLTKEIEFTKEEAIQILISIGVYKPDQFKKFKSKVTGREVFSVLLPDDFDFIGKSLDGKEVIVKKGNLIEGVIDKATIGESNGSLIRSLFAIYSEDVGIQILGEIFRLGIAALLKRGFTTSIADTDLNKNVKDQVEEIISEAEKRAKRYINQYENKELTLLHGMTEKETVEIRIMESLNEARNSVGKLIAKISNEENPTIIMANSGAKGKTLNLAQMAACVGQQVVHGKRVEKGYRKRVLSMFEENNIEPEAHGWIRGGFKSGLKPYEFFMHALTGRDALMDTALRTPKSGYLYRRLVNALQDLRVEYDGTVRDSNSNIVQFKYGEDGIDVSKSEAGTINVEKIVKEVVKL